MDGTDLRERNRSANMAEVQRVALTLMRQRGFDGVTVVQVAEGSGVSPSTVYRYFGTKEALVLSGDGTDQIVPTLAATAPGKRTTPPAELFGRAVKAMLADVDQQALLIRLQLVFADPDLTAAFEHEIFGRRHDLADVLASHRGAAMRGVRDDAAAGALLGVFISILDRWQRLDGKKSLLRTFEKSWTSLS